MTGWVVKAEGLVGGKGIDIVEADDIAALAQTVALACTAHQAQRVEIVRRDASVTWDDVVAAAHPVTPSEVERLLVVCDDLLEVLHGNSTRHHRLQEAVEAVRRAGGDPIETGREAALGQWEERWRALRATAHWFIDTHPDDHAVTAGSILVEMDKIEQQIPVGLPVGGGGS